MSAAGSLFGYRLTVYILCVMVLSIFYFSWCSKHCGRVRNKKE